MISMEKNVQRKVKQFPTQWKIKETACNLVINISEDFLITF